ncbi:MAG: hypothetical protein AAFP89_02650 [Bacteroidota bacterium]
MKKRKVKYILAALSKSEQEYFMRWLNAELHDRQFFVQKLATILIEEMDTPTSDQEVWNHLYPDKPYDDARLRKLLSDLRHWLHEFLAIQSFRQDPHTRHKFILDAFSRRGLKEEFQRHFRRIPSMHQRLDTQVQAQDLARWRYEMAVEQQWYIFKNQSKLIPGLKYTQPDWGQSEITSISDLYLEANLLELITLYLGLRSNRKSHEQTPQLEKIRALIQIMMPEDRSNISFKLSTYLTIYDTIENISLEKLHALFASIKLTTAMWAPSDLYTMFSIFYNQFQRLLNKREVHNFYMNVRDLYIWAIEHNILQIEGVLSPASYRNLVIFCIRTQAYTLAQKYMIQLKDQLPLGLREETFTICKAMLLTEQGQFTKVLKLLGMARFQVESFEINGRWLSLQAHHGLYPEDTEWRLQQTERHLRYTKSRKLLNPRFQLAYQNQFRLYKRILTVTPEKQQKILNEIRKINPVHNKPWLMRLLSHDIKTGSQ